MNIYEIDWRYSSIEAILDAAGIALKSIDKSVADGDMDGNEALEQRESFLGIAFVAAQTYIYGAIADATKLAKARSKPKPKDSLSKKFSDVIPKKRVTKIQVCYAIADYFKHEWPNWTPKPKRGDSRKPLYDAGISETTDYPCQDAAKILLKSTSSDLSPLLSMLAAWRKKLLASYK